MKAYKYTPKKFVAGLLEKGIVRIGTLSEYRKNDHPEIGDSGEGSENVTTRLTNFERENLTSDNISDMPYAIRQMISIQGGGKIGNLSVGRATVRNRNVYPDAYLYCVTEFPSEATMHEFINEDGDENCCIEISDIAKFGQIIGQKLFEEGLLRNEWHHARCVYGGREIIDDAYEGNPKNNLNVYFWKELRHQAQKEYRLLYMPALPIPAELTSRIITCPDLVGLCSIYSF